MKLLITGGHHSSALPVIEELKKIKPGIEFVWVGHKHSMENDKNLSLEYQDIISLEIPFYDISAQKFYGVYNPLRLARIMIGVFNAGRLLRKEKPEGVLSFGGYIAFPVVCAAYFLGIPSVTHEQILQAGIANKAISIFVKKIFVSHKETLKYYSPKKTVFTGLPLRKEIFTTTSDVFHFDNNDPVLYVTGGKQGSHKINMALKEVLLALLEHCNVIHQCGNNSETDDLRVLEDTKAQIPEEFRQKYVVTPYIKSENIGEVFAKADLVVSRAGAHTVFELAALQRALLIPITNVARSEQIKNAQLYVSTGLGEILYEKDLSGEALFEKITYMLKEQEQFVYNDSSNFYINKDAAKNIAYETCKAILK